MEKRIRIVWMFSLVSALLVIGVQGYWLYNQYEFVLNNYAQELADKILETGEEEYRLRLEKMNIDYTFTVNTKAEYSNNNKGEVDGKQSLAFGFYKKDSIEKQKYNTGIDSLINYAKNVKETIDNMSANGVDTASLALGPVAFKLSIDPNLPQELIQLNVAKAVTNMHSPFKEELLDSLLTAKLPDLQFHYSLEAKVDSSCSSHWERLGTFFSPRLRTVYAYSPFEGKGVVIDTEILTQPLLNRMAVQLFLAFGLILLLIGCLIFQIKTILKQRKIGELRQSFVNTMIHELKRPVQTLKTFVSFLGDKEMHADEQTTEQVVQDAMFELDNLSAYLNKLKDMMRADDPETPLNLVKFNLKDLTEKVVRLIHIPQGKEVEFAKYFDMESPEIEADPIHLANVLSNLIENAIKYSGDRVSIEIKARRQGRELHLTVSDNGIGIPMIEQDKVFAKFYRGSNMPNANIPGLGLGLSYVKLISEAHQGSVCLQSNLGQGTSVTLYLPQ